jgi:hypothetical protein
MIRFESAMAAEIAPTRPEDLPELGRFLAEGFRLGPDAPLASPDFLRWKYFDPVRDGDDRPRSLLAREGGRIVGHLGFSLPSFRLAAVPPDPPRELGTLHMMDWLGTRGHPGVGASLMREANRLAETQYGLGGSEAGRAVIKKAGYESMPPVPVFRKVLRVGYRWRTPGGPMRRALGVARDAARGVIHRGRPPASRVAPLPVEAFGAEVDAILDACPGPLLFTDRRAGVLNHFLRYPPGGAFGWRLERDGEALGFALGTVIAEGATRLGKVAECFLPSRDPDLWHSAFSGVARALAGCGADVALACGYTPWEAEGLQRAGFLPGFTVNYTLRDPDGLLPRDVPYHVTYLEADYAYS